MDRIKSILEYWDGVPPYTESGLTGTRINNPINEFDDLMRQRNVLIDRQPVRQLQMSSRPTHDSYLARAMRERNVGLEQMPMRQAVPLRRRSLSDLFGIGAKKVKDSRLNPKNWGVPDYSDKGSRGAAYAAAKRAGEKEFMWNNKRFNTKSDMSPEQQMKVYGITDKQRLKSNIVRDRMEDNIYHFEYYTKNPIVKMKNVVLDNEKEVDYLDIEGKIPERLKTHKDFLSLYLGKPQKYNTASISKYKPSDSKEKDKEYFSVNSKEFQNYILKHLDENYITQGIRTGEITAVKDKNGKVIPNRYLITDIGTGLGEFTIDRGKDENGEYISYWDKWDLNPYKGAYSYMDISSIEDLSFGIGKPYNIYDRIYFRDNPDSNKFKEYDDKIDELWDLAIKTQDKKYIDEVHKLYPIRKSYYNKQGKYIRQYYSDKELSELDINKKNFDTLALQRELSNRGYELPKSTREDGTLDGILGDETKEALLDYQTKNKPVGGLYTLSNPIDRLNIGIDTKRVEQPRRDSDLVRTLMNREGLTKEELIKLSSNPKVRENLKKSGIGSLLYNLSKKGSNPFLEYLKSK